MPFEGTDTDEEYKRKRDDEYDEGPDKVFGRSKVTKRSPGTKRNSDETMINIMKQLMSKNDEIMEELRELRKEQAKNNKELVDSRKENNELKAKIKTLDDKIEYMERENKKKNLIITGLQIGTNNDQEIKENI